MQHTSGAGLSSVKWSAFLVHNLVLNLEKEQRRSLNSVNLKHLRLSRQPGCFENLRFKANRKLSWNSGLKIPKVSSETNSLWSRVYLAAPFDDQLKLSIWKLFQISSSLINRSSSGGLHSTARSLNIALLILLVIVDWNRPVVPSALLVTSRWQPSNPTESCRILLNLAEPCKILQCSGVFSLDSKLEFGLVENTLNILVVV